MAKKSSVQKNERRVSLISKLRAKRDVLKKKVYNKNLSLKERFALVTELSELPRNSSRVRMRNRCILTGRPRGVYTKFMLSRNMLRKLANEGLLPGIRKSSW